MESALWVAGVYDELFGSPHRASRDLVSTQESGGYCIGVDACTDCFSLFSTLRNADLVRPSDESLVVHVSTLRQDLSEG